MKITIFVLILALIGIYYLETQRESENEDASSVDINHARAAEYQLKNDYPQSKEYQQAVSFFTQAIEQRPNNPSAYYELSQLYGMVDNYPKQIELLETAIEIKPHLIKYQVALSEAYIQNGEFEKAIELLTPSNEQEPEILEIVLPLAKALMKSEQYQEALYYLEQYTELTSIERVAFSPISRNHWLPYIYQAVCYYELGDYLTSDELLAQVISNTSDNGFEATKIFFSMIDPSLDDYSLSLLALEKRLELFDSMVDQGSENLAVHIGLLESELVNNTTLSEDSMLLIENNFGGHLDVLKLIDMFILLQTIAETGQPLSDNSKHNFLQNHEEKLQSGLPFKPWKAIDVWIANHDASDALLDAMAFFDVNKYQPRTFQLD